MDQNQSSWVEVVRPMVNLPTLSDNNAKYVVILINELRSAKGLDALCTIIVL